MKKILIFLIVILVMLSTPMIVGAADNSDKKNIDPKDQEKVESLYDYITTMRSKFEIMNDIDAKEFVNNYIETGNGGDTTNKIYKGILIYLFKELLSSSKLMIMVVVIAILAALINNLQNAFSNESLSNIAYFACYSILIIVVSKSFLIALDLVKGTINDITNFMSALVPVLVMLVASVGGISEATVMDPIILGGINIGVRIYVSIIIPLILIGFVLQFVNNISEDYKISKLTKLINQWALWGQGILMTVFIGIITIRGISSKTMDIVTAKTTKYAVDNFVPVVGKCLSDAISTVAGYSLLLKNALSSLGLIIIVIVVLAPILKVFIMAMLYKFTAAMIEPISDKRIVNCVTAAGDSLILIMSCLISVSIMFFIMISILASTGTFIMGG